MRNNKTNSIRHCTLSPEDFDPYELVKSKMARLSWNSEISSDVYIDKYQVIDWFSCLRDFSDDTVKAILVDGLLENKFHNITYIFKLAQSSEFGIMASQQLYQLLFTFVNDTPKSVRMYLDEDDYAMSRDVLALLSRNRG